MATVRRIVRSGDPISKISGAFSGTLGFVMSGLEAGKSFSAVVEEAKEFG
jgi:homoserine dehydrogenase